MTTLEAPAHAPIAATKAPRWVVMVSDAHAYGEIRLVASPSLKTLSPRSSDAHDFDTRATAVAWIRDNQGFLGSRKLTAYSLDLNADALAGDDGSRAHPRDRRPDLGGLTPRQAEFLEYIEERTHRGLPPTIRELGLKFGIGSPNGVNCHLKALQKKGYIERDAKLSRSIRLTY